ncbi:MAG: protein BatD [Bacteroidetes bacterium]|nr:MAG: protein BatD [Bacteroidota bacterium]
MRQPQNKRSAWLMAIALLTLSVPAGLSAQSDVTFEASGPTREVAEGTRFEVSFTLKNTTAKRFIPPDFNGFRVTSGPSEMRGAGFFNGRSYSHQSWSYELEAGEPGAYTIGSATVQTAGGTLRTQPLVVRVGKARISRNKVSPGADDRVFITGELDRETAWLGQQVHYQVKLYTQVGISNYDILDLPPFDGFFAQERRRFDTRTQYQKIKGKKYAVRILHEVVLFPQQTGSLRIGTARVRLGVEQPGSLSALLGSMPVLAQTQAVKLEVNPLPEPEPANFSGVAGRYRWQVTADKDSLTTDDALTLTVKVEGNGDVRRFANPALDLPPGLEGFEPKVVTEEEYETGEEMVHARILEYIILPRQPGNYDLLPEMVVFDPDSNRYQHFRPDTPIQVRVTAGTMYGRDNTALDTIAGPPAVRDEPISQFWHTATNWLTSPWLWGTILLLALFPVFVYWRRHRRQTPQPKPAGDERTPLTLKVARGRLAAVSNLLNSTDSRTFYNELLKALQANIAAHLQLEPTVLTTSIVQEKLAARGVPAQTVATLVQVWTKCEQAVFADQGLATERHATFQQAETALKDLETALRH